MNSHPQAPPSTRPSPWTAGTVIAGKYRLVSPIGAGGMGQVWRAEHLSLGSLVAVKLVDLASSPNPQETLARFLHEARAAASIKHANVVQTLDHGAQGHVAYIVMELLEGVSLAKRLEKTRVLPVSDVVRIFREIARALEKAHAQGIVHRDLKPENVFIAIEDGREVIKLLDFGIAKTSDGGKDPHLKTQVGTVVGTPSYMSPEQVLGRPLDYRSDLWQIAMIAFECVTGQRAFAGNTLGELFMRICTAPLPIPSQIAPGVPIGFDAWFARAANRDPNGRFQSIRELVETLALVLLRSGAGGPATVPLGATKDTEIMDPPAHGAAWSSGASGQRSARRALTIALAVLPILAAGVAGAVWIVAGSRDDSSPVPAASAQDQGSNAVPETSTKTPPTPAPTPAEPTPAASATSTLTDVQDAGAPSMQNVPDAGKGTKFVKPRKDHDLGF
ncbi:MAG: serine/threonine protein kinase [Polyangiaceae bacterium]|nr:serine/threonine protein kinase [Polyangiaceae bacterium]